MSVTSQERPIEPSVFERAPYFTAFVMGSCRIMLSVRNYMQDTTRIKKAHLWKRWTNGLIAATTTCLVPDFDGALFSDGWKDALWDRFTTGAPQRQRRSLERYKRA